MSGGSYDYAYFKLESFASSIRLEGSCDCASPQLRKAFREHCLKVSAAMRAIEWNDSCDGDTAEAELIQACLPAGAEIGTAIEDAEKIRDVLTCLIEKATSPGGGQKENE